MRAVSILRCSSTYPLHRATSASEASRVVKVRLRIRLFTSLWHSTVQLKASSLVRIFGLRRAKYSSACDEHPRQGIAGKRNSNILINILISFNVKLRPCGKLYAAMCIVFQIHPNTPGCIFLPNQKKQKQKQNKIRS